MNFIVIDDSDVYQRAESVYEYQHTREHGADTSEGMSNSHGSCWMISVLQALRASFWFQHLYSPANSAVPSKLQRELFRLFDIMEGKNGQKKRLVTAQETLDFKRLLIQEGLPVGLRQAYLEEPFLKFFLKKLQIPQIHYTIGGKKYRKQLLSLPLKEQKEPRQLQTVIKELQAAFVRENEVPKFLPVFLDRPEIKRYTDQRRYRIEASRVPIIPTSTLNIPVGKKMASFELVAIVVGRDSKSHAYTYVIQGKKWVEYNDHDVIVHEEPMAGKRRAASHHTPFTDACAHSAILVYEWKETL